MINITSRSLPQFNYKIYVRPLVIMKNKKRNCKLV